MQCLEPRLELRLHLGDLRVLVLETLVELLDRRKAHTGCVGQTDVRLIVAVEAESRVEVLRRRADMAFRGVGL